MAVGALVSPRAVVRAVEKEARRFRGGVISAGRIPPLVIAFVSPFASASFSTVASRSPRSAKGLLGGARRSKPEGVRHRKRDLVGLIRRFGI